MKRLGRLFKGERAQRLVVTLGGPLLRGLLSTLRYRPLDETTRRWAESPPTNAIYCFWHARLLAPLFSHRNRGIGVMISRSRDGDIIADLAELMGFEPVRGSTSKGGGAALRRMVEIARDGRHLAVTPDGPRGPRHSYQMGTIYLARLTGLPILNAGVGLTRYWTLPSWDRFMVPKPGALAVYKVDEPVYVPRRASRDELEALRVRLENRLRALTDSMDEYTRALC